MITKFASLILSLIQFLTAPLQLPSSQQISMETTLHGGVLEHGYQYDVRAGDEILVSADSADSGIAFIAYYFAPVDATEKELDQAFENRAKIVGEQAVITVPTAKTTGQTVLWVEAVAENDDGSPNTITKTGWSGFYLNYSAEGAEPE